MHNSRDAETGDEHHPSGADWQRIMITQWLCGCAVFNPDSSGM
jgi:hypothetical protein